MKKRGKSAKNKKKAAIRYPLLLLFAYPVAFYYGLRLEKGIIQPFVDPICRAPDGAWRIIYLLLDRTHTPPRL